MFNLTNTQSKTRGREVETPLEMMTMNDARGEDGDVSFSFSCLDLVEVLEEILILEVCSGYGGGGYGEGSGGRAPSLGRGWIVFSLDSSPPYIGVGGRFREPTELGAEYAYRAFTNVVPFDETEPSEPSTGGRYRRVLPVPMVAIRSGLSYIGRHFFIRTPI